MNETDKEKVPSVNKKGSGPDGLSKKERRALRVAQKGDNINELPKAKPGDAPIKASVNDLSKLHSKSNTSVKQSIREKELNNKHKIVPQGETNTNFKLFVHVKASAANESEIISKAQLKAERRALQEKQRQAKAEVTKQEQVITKPAPIKHTILKSDHLGEHQVNLFNHLYFSSCETNKIIIDIHVAFIRLGVQYSSKTIVGSNARCLALLSALKDLVNDFVTPPKQEFCRSLEGALQKCVSHLQACRPMAVSMTNALRHFKLQLTQISANLDDDNKKHLLLQAIEIYIQDEIAKAGEAISLKVNEKITDDDIILTYGCSSLVRRLLLDAHKAGKKFKVIIIDSRPLLEGKEMLRVLYTHGIDCTYLLINSASFIMNKVTKVILGAHALLANGYVMSRTGTAQVALIAQAYSKPVLVCCETYKFCERVQTDSFVYNEIGDPDMLVNVDTLEEQSPLARWRNSKFLTPLNLLYDITPTDLVTAVVTELGFLPCTSVPVVLRIRPTE